MKSKFSKKSFETFIWISVLSLGILISFNVMAQPSGGPYGPVRQTWQLAKVDGRIYYVAPDGDKDAAGDKLEKPTTIEAAFESSARPVDKLIWSDSFRGFDVFEDVLDQVLNLLPRPRQPVRGGVVHLHGSRYIQ